MIVGLDYRPVLTSGAGIGRYVRGLVQGLAAITPRTHAPADNAITRFSLYACHWKRFPAPPPGPEHPAFRLHRGPVPARLLHALSRVGYGTETHFGRVDLFHFTDFTWLPFRRTPHVFTLHDLSFRVEPAWHEPRAVEALNRVVDRLVPGARLVLVHSHHTAGEVSRWMGVAPDRIRVIPPGVDRAFFAGADPDHPEHPDHPDHAVHPAHTPAAIQRRLALPRSYVLYVGTLEPRKNLVRLVHAFDRVAGHWPELGLVLAGSRGWLEDEVFQAVAGARHGHRIQLPGRIPDADLPALYRGASVVAYVSHYEGFGLPVLEALAAGVPVVAARAASLPEAAGSAAWLVDPEDEVAMADALETALRDREAGRHQERIQEGRRHAARFTWERTARLTLDAYQEALR